MDNHTDVVSATSSNEDGKVCGKPWAQLRALCIGCVVLGCGGDIECMLGVFTGKAAYLGLGLTGSLGQMRLWVALAGSAAFRRCGAFVPCNKGCHMGYDILQTWPPVHF